MIQRDDGRGLGEAVALDHQKPKLGEERFQIGRQRRRANDKAPELPAEQPMHFAIAPPAAQPVAFPRLQLAQFRKCLDEMRSQDFENLRYRYQHRNAPRANLPQDFVRMRSRA